MSKILVVPDVHGRTFWRKAKELINDMDKVVFLGDYLDPYSYEGITREEAIKEFEEIIKFKKENQGKVILLLGNHDCAYCFNFGNASRYDYSNELEIKSLFAENSELFRLFYQEDDILFSHAGVTNEWLNKYFSGCSIDDFMLLPTDDVVPYLWAVSYRRGGQDVTGSIVWSDVREGNRESTYYQIFGHTQQESEPIINDQYACLDVRRCFIVNTLTLEIKEL